MDSKELRQKFLDFFKEKGHTVLPSVSLVPENDPSVLFTTAGMQQFKRYYSYPNEAPAAAVTTVQKCIRTADINEVGDNTHLTFFEMLGNFSFGYPSMKGSYFKKEAIEMAWEFLTSGECLGIDKKRIYATYFDHDKAKSGIAVTVDTDSESKKILEKLSGLEKIEPQGEDNFWTLGTIGSPAGPTVEFYVDGIEIWNLVFNEMVLQEIDGKMYWQSSENKGVDTGMGLERLLTVINGVENVYHTDLFDLPHQRLREIGHLGEPVLDSIGDGRGVYPSKLEERSGANSSEVSAERIILDHLKAATFIINDGVIPSNKDRGYILRRLVRRAVVKAQQIGITDNFTPELAKKYFETYEGAYHFDQKAVTEGLDQEESKFRRTLSRGLKIFESMKRIKGMTVNSTTHPARFNGKELFDLYQENGFPIELSLELAKEAGTPIENKEIRLFDHLLKSHQELSRTASAGMFKGGLAQDGGEAVIKYHTAAHLLLAVLRKVLGDHVVQKGSNITAERLRLDFSHPQKLTDEELKAVENLVNEQIKKDLPVTCKEMGLQEAKNSGAMGVFDSKYGDKVKVYTIGANKRGLPPAVSGTVSESKDYFSREICGGPHVSRTGELGRFKITKEEASSAGIRRIKAILEQRTIY